MEYSKLGFKCGLEIHQQLDTGKLFCSDWTAPSRGAFAPYDLYGREKRGYNGL